MAQQYSPPKQSKSGQIVDVVVVLALVFLALFLPLWLKIAVPSRVEKLPEGVSYVMQANADGTESKVWTGLTWEALGQNPVMQKQWEKLGQTPEMAADMITMPFEYDIDYLGILMTALVMVGYYTYVLRVSEKEYREVVREKFD